ncbi:COX15/CtaA family protein [Arthrobacter sp. zg-Y820]|uniref:COX15/CtaA family protein n=1 Tax=unclassified Arthrobacter TaxID=235627 RepID=UPI002540EA8D|nr:MULTISPECIES: COX15/CtaA family protein [unclassified Arthrobacter]MCC9196622.1 COX15/CtaA family protein [Arthrobacter sp. zg-Y820]MDK1279484.1 COX15/CtaA family protein [Arthrobacter sp. zg.Y820]WIB08139.1 COX15/CtaA family protein [Arthrobacter sp. zg-Y820]
MSSASPGSSPAVPQAGSPDASSPAASPAAGKTVRTLAVATLVANIAIVVTGGAVRLTASGLGCPEWPLCTPDSLTTTPEMGVHGIIEFGNRLLTFVLAAIAFAMVFSVWSARAERRDLFRLSIVLLAGIPAQALLGGITVWTGLNPWIVGGHFILSMFLIVLATVLVNRAWLTPAQLAGTNGPLATRTLRPLLGALGVLSALAVVLGVVVTGSGPHAGDHGAARNGLDPDLMTRIHVVPVYMLVFALAVALYLVFRHAADGRLRRSLLLLTAVVLAQAVIGYAQHFLHLPIVLVGLHMLGASLLTAAAAHVVFTGFSRQVPGKDAGAASGTAAPVRSGAAASETDVRR